MDVSKEFIITTTELINFCAVYRFFGMGWGWSLTLNSSFYSLYDLSSNVKAILHHIDATVQAQIMCHRSFADVHFFFHVGCQEPASADSAAV